MRPAFLLVSTLSLTTLAYACIHTPKDWEGSLEQTGQSAIALWDKGVQDLVIRPSIRVKGAKTAPASIAWVVPVPSQPSSYGEVKPEAFQDLFKAWERLHQPRSNSRGLRSKGIEPDAQRGGIELLEPAVAGDYAIQPIKTVGPAGGEALNAWLTENGFGAVPAENMAYYVERDWVWLCVKAKASSPQGDLKPLRITFKSEKVVYPLKFSTHQGTFDLTLWVVTKSPLAGLKRVREGHKLQISSIRMELPKSVAACAKGTKLGEQAQVTKVTRKGLSGPEIVSWKTDLEFEPGS